MNLNETYNLAKKEYNENLPKSTFLYNEKELEEINGDSIFDLSISSRYEGEMPNLSFFPNLKEFHCFKTINSDYLNYQDLSKLENIYLSLDNAPFHLKLTSLSLKKLEVHIVNNDSPQLDLFTMGERILDISSCSILETLSLSTCDGLKVVTAGEMPQVTNLIVSNTKQPLDELIQSFPNVKFLSLSGCGISKLAFLVKCRNIKYLNLSRNLIEDIEELLNYPKLDMLDLYRNPIKNLWDLGRLRCDILFYTEKDYELSRLLNDIRFNARMIYKVIQDNRKNIDELTPYQKKYYEKHKDIELFEPWFATKVKGIIQEHTAKKLYGSQIRLSTDEMREYILNHYPFLEDSLKEL